MKKNNNGLSVLLVGFLIVIAACVKTNDQYSDNFVGFDFLGPDNEISITNSEYSPSVFAPNLKSVKKGMSVLWRNLDSVEHNVISVDGTSFNSGNIASSREYSYKTVKTGSFPYYCEKHGEYGTLVVTP